MRTVLTVVVGIACCTSAVTVRVRGVVTYVDPTAEEVVAKNTDAKGGLAKIKAIKSLSMTGRF